MPERPIKVSSLLLILAFYGCSSAPKGPPKVTAISLSPSNPTINYGGAVQLSLITQPPGSAVTGSVIWGSSDPHTVFVSEGVASSGGFADFGGTGSATITAQVSGLQASTTVTVLPPPINIAIGNQSPQTFVGTPLLIVALDVTVPYPPLSQPVITPDSWTSSDVSVATISSAGVVTPVAPGLTTVTATWRGAVSSTVLQVWAAPARFFYVAGSSPADISGFKIIIVPAVTEDQGGTFIEQWLPTSTAPTVLSSSPSALAADPSGKFLFVTSSQSNNVSAFSIEQTTGNLSAAPNSPLATGAGPVSAAVDAGGKYLYVANSTDSTISAYSIDNNTAALTPLIGFPVPTGLNPSAMEADAGGFLYVVNSGSDSLSIFSINATSGALAAVVGSPFSTGHNPSAVAEYSPGNFVT